jgi:hypothetical protein
MAIPDYVKKRLYSERLLNDRNLQSVHAQRRQYAQLLHR